jgi:hypothetical protein
MGQKSDGREDQRMLCRILLAAGVAALALPAAASAATITNTPGETVYQAAAGDLVEMQVYAGWDQELSDTAVFFLPSNATVTDPTTTDASCKARPAGASSCALRNRTRIQLGGRDDFVGVTNASDTVEVHLGAGNDRQWTTGSKVEAYGDDGDDSLQGGPGFDKLDGGAGNDVLDPYSFGDAVTGGPGFDTARESAAGVVVTLDDVANDGVPGEGQNIKSDVEKVAAGSGSDELEGNALPNTLSGGDGADTLTGNGGADTLLGDAGADTINARDGAADDVNCGPGADTAVVDPADTVTSCETVNLPDADADGVTAPQDCDDQNPAIHPGATDVPGDGVDQDCTGADTPGATPPPGGGGGGGAVVPSGPGRVAARIVGRWGLARRSTTVIELTVKDIPADGRVAVLCSGKGCGFDRRTVSPRGGAAKLAKLFNGRRLKRGTVVEIRVTAPGMTGKVVRYTVRDRRKLPASATLCLPSGAGRPGAC